LAFLNDVASHVEHNKMTPTNLAVVFGPNLFAARDDTLFTRDERTVEFLIINASRLLPVSDDSADVVENGDVVDAAAAVVDDVVAGAATAGEKEEDGEGDGDAASVVPAINLLSSKGEESVTLTLPNIDATTNKTQTNNR
jgi:hypothetical protein